MPTKGQDQLPDRSKPETTNRELSIDEKKEDVRRLQKYLVDFERLLGGVEQMNHPEHRQRLKGTVLNCHDAFRQTGDMLKQEIRNWVYAQRGLKDEERGGRRTPGASYRYGRSGQRGGPKF